MTRVHENDLALIHKSIRIIQNWPEPGVSFRDITTLLQDPKAFHKVIDIFLQRYKDKDIDVVAGLDARGFIFGPVVAYELGIGFVPVRKKGKLPYQTYAENYTLEYGDITTVEVHIDAVSPGDSVLIIDDLIATGGTMLASCKLIERLGAKVYECAVVNDLLYLGGSAAIRKAGFGVYSILEHN
jgi:adenine phosphoribosyltransferase